MAGRKPTPTHLKLLAGNPGKRAPNKREPKPKRGIPRCPEDLSDVARAMWARIGPELDRMGVLTVADGVALELLCDAYAEYRAAREVITRGGMTYSCVTEAGGTMTRQRPEVTIASDAYRRVTRMLTEFGLTPSSRTKVQITPDAARDPLEELIGAGR